MAMTSKMWMWALTLAAVIVGSYYGYALGDRSKPYDRIFGIAQAVNPDECIDENGNPLLPPGPIPVAIHASGGDCVRQEWTVDRHKPCNVVPSDPYVYRWVIDEANNLIKLPVIHSLQVNGIVPRMSKTFVHPRVPTLRQQWISYRARVDVACPIDAFLLRGFVNPLQLLWPIRIEELSTEYQVVAD